jgi:hypothetical protein
VVNCGLDSSDSRQGPVAGSCEYGNEPSGSIRGGDFFRVAEWLLASQGGFRSKELVS